jgi:hypothetical protein
MGSVGVGMVSLALVLVVLSLALDVLSFLGARGFLTLTSMTCVEDMVKEVVMMLIKRVICDGVRRIKRVQFFAKKVSRRTFFKIERNENLFGCDKNRKIMVVFEKELKRLIR